MKVRAPETPPPGAGVTTATWAKPEFARSASPIDAVRVFALMKVVGRVALFHCTTEELEKLDPVTVRVRPGEPATAFAGESDEITGAGFPPVTVTEARCTVPLSAADRVTACEVVVAAAVAVIVALLAPAGITTTEGIEIKALLLRIGTDVALATLPERLIVQETCPPAGTVAGEQVKEDREIGTCTTLSVPPTAIIGMEVASGPAPTALTERLIVPTALLDAVTRITPILPSGIVF